MNLKAPLSKLALSALIKDYNSFESTLCDKIYSGFEENYEFETSIGDLIDYIQPNRFIVSINEYSNDNTLIPVLTANKSFILGYTEDTEGICSIGECVIFDDFTMDMKFVNFPFKVKSSAIKILKPKPGSNIRFLYDYLKFLKLNSGEHKRHYISEIEPKTLKLPNIILQNKVSNLMRSHDSKILIEENILSYLMMLKEYLLKKIFI